MTKIMATALETRFRFPVDKTRILPLDHPEIQLVALLVVATKLCFPLGNGNSPLQDPGGVRLPHFDWDTWKQGFLPPLGHGEALRSNADFEETTPAQVASMGDEDFEAYLAHVVRVAGDRESKRLSDGFSSLALT